MTGEQQRHAQILAQTLRTVATSAGPLHAWWDLIHDLEAALQGKELLLLRTDAALIAAAEQALADHSHSAHGVDWQTRGAWVPPSEE